MARPRIHEIAKELGIENKEVLRVAIELGMEVKTVSSSVSEEEAGKIKAKLGNSGAGKKAEDLPSQKVEKPAEAEKPVENVKPLKDDVPAPPKAEKSAEKSPKAQGSKPTGAVRKPIIIVNNGKQGQQPRAYTGGQTPVQGSKTSQGKAPSQGSRMGQNAPSGKPEPRRIIKPLTAPSDTPAVNMVQDPKNSAPAKKPKPEAEVKPQEQENVQTPLGNVSEAPKVPRQISINDAPGQRSKGGFRGGNVNGQGSQQTEKTQGGFNRGSAQGRQGSFQGQTGSAKGGFSAGNSGRNFPGVAGGQRPNGRPGAGFGNGRSAGPGKIFTSDGPTSNKGSRDQRRRNEERNSKHKDIKYNEDELTRSKKAGRFIKPEKKVEEVEEETIKVITLPDTITIGDLATKMKMKSSDIIKKLFLSGKVVTVNQEISYEDAENIAMEYEILCEHEVKVNVIEELLKEGEEDADKLQERPPVVCVMGHVDHGKTSLLDAIRKTHVTSREAGGITQAIGAYTVDVKGKSITFLDTPGHEAFTAMRMRGANSTDIAILVVAADDGVMPQTIEAINHAKAAGVEIIVAVNKIDKPSANIDRVKQELSEYELISEDWGGSTVFAPVSAKTGEGLDNLLDMILLTADVLELKANPDRQARGVVIEAQLDKGRGPVATILVQKGTLHVGDFVSAGAAHGKVRAMINDKGENVKTATPSTPVEILGLSSVPEAGEVFLAHESDKEAKSYADTYTAENKKQKLAETQGRMSLEDLFSKIKEENLKELDIIIKADVQGSVEALKESLLKLSNEEVIVKVIHGGVGAINESDVNLAGASNAIIIGFNVKPDTQAQDKAEAENVDVRCYDVIYKAIEDIERAMKGLLDPVFEEKIIGHAEIRQIFKASAIGNIAGSYVLDGIMQRGCKARITRGEEQIYEGELSSLKRFKDDVKEVKEGFECGLVFDGFDSIQELDRVEAFVMVEVPRT